MPLTVIRPSSISNTETFTFNSVNISGNLIVSSTAIDANSVTLALSQSNAAYTQANTGVFNMLQSGELTITTGTSRWWAPFNLQITNIKSRLRTAADDIVTININKNNSLAKSFTFSASSNTTTITSPYFSMNENDYLTVDVTTIGTSVKGTDLYIQFFYSKT
jgi:hypothetical protein